MLTLLAILTIPGTPLPQQSEAQTRLATICAEYRSTNTEKTLIRADALNEQFFARDSVATAEWRELGCLRAMLSFSGAKLPKNDLIGMPKGSSWMTGAAAVFLERARESRPIPQIEEAVLATQLVLAEPTSPDWELIDAVAAVTLIATRRNPRAAGSESCATLKLMVSDTASARECLKLTRRNPEILPTVKTLPQLVQMDTRVNKLWDERGHPMLLLTFAMRQSSELQGAELDFHQLVLGKRNAEYVCRTLAGAKLLTLREVRYASCPLGRDGDLVQRARMAVWLSESGDLLEDESNPESVRSATAGSVKLTSTGFVPVSLPPGGISWSLNLKLEGAGRGARVSSAHVDPSPCTTFCISDLILGSAAQNLRAVVGEDSIWTAPFNTFSRGQPLSLYFQTRSEAAREKATITLVVAPLKNGIVDTRKQSVRYTFPAIIRRGIAGVHKEIAVRELEPGEYQISITATDTSTGAVVSEKGIFVVQQ